MKRAMRWLLRTFCAAALLLIFNGALLLAAGYSLLAASLFNPLAAWATHFYGQTVPEEIEVTSLVAYGSDVGPGDLLIAVVAPIRREGCGGFAFRLSDQAALEIETQGIARLASAHVGRGYKGDRLEYFYSYAPWQQTPVPKSWLGDGIWATSMGCFREGARDFDAAAIYQAVSAPGAYFTTGREKQMLVIPQLRLVVVTYFG